MSSPQQFEDKLTPVARQALEELVEDYRTQLLFGAGDSASRLGDLREISVHDVLTALATHQRQMPRVVGSQVQRFLRMYSITGALLGTAGVVWFVVQDMDSLRSLGSRPSLLFAVAGFTLSALSYLVLRTRQRDVHRLRPERDQRIREYQMRYLSIWSDVEMALRVRAAAELGESAAGAPVAFLINRIPGGGSLSSEDRDRLRELLELRNALAHGVSVDMDMPELTKATIDGERLVGVLRSIPHRE